ncbi:sodium:solute symporter [Arenibacter palladensis]|uniref:sodium:solute symporter n=1 Tax=Arenibacter palladensis TaxID=237373 RepID=UPI0026E21B1F|nr:sodium:solute symporter [Arenibacter palladensis]MDO6603952.1 sodium:solute symporter [Arenibacter palladensis]
MKLYQEGIGLHPVDIFIIIISLILTLYIAYHFSSGQKSTKKFFVAEGNIPSWAVGMSLLATIVSSITFLAYPGAGFSNNWILLVQGVLVAITLLIIIWVIVPLYRNIIGISAYEYFEQRFGYFARFYASLAFVLAYFSKMGTILYLVGLAIASMVGIDPLVVIWTLGIFVLILTLSGGMEAIIWLDVIQGFLLIAGGVVVLTILVFSIDGGVITIWQIANRHDRIGFGPYNWDFVNLTFWVMAINGFFFAIQNFGTNQLIVQRFLAARSNKEAIKASLIGILLSIPLWSLFMFIGTALFVFYQLNPQLLSDNTSADAVFPLFIMHELPIGITGFVISALIAAAFSSLDSELNSISAVLTEDFYSRVRKNATDKQKLVFGKWMIVVAGVLAMLVATSYTLIGSEGALSTVFTLYAIFSGGIAGIFLLGIASKRANKQGLYIGVISCIIFTGYAVATSTSFNNRLILDFGQWNFTHHKYMLGVYSHIIVLIVGYIASLFFKSPNIDINLTYLGWLNIKRKSIET